MLEAINYEEKLSLYKIEKSIYGNRAKLSLPWVALLEDECPKFGFTREFVKRDLDFSKSNGSGSRGVFFTYILEEGKVYEIFRNVTWRRSERIFAIVSNEGDLVEIDKDEAQTIIAHNIIDETIKKEFQKPFGL